MVASASVLSKGLSHQSRLFPILLIDHFHLPMPQKAARNDLPNNALVRLSSTALGGSRPDVYF